MKTSASRYGGPRLDRARPRRATSSLLLCLALLLPACGQPPAPPTAAQPPLGSWQLVAIDGAIRIRHGGGAVICRQGEVEFRPAPLYDPQRPNASTLRLETGRFLFSIEFDEGSYPHTFTNAGNGGGSFRGRWFESRSELRTEASFHWQLLEQQASELAVPEPYGVAGSVTTGSAPEDWQPTFDLEPLPFQEILDEPWITFEMNGNFVAVTELEGRWAYHERTRLGGCWSYGEGSGTWKAQAAQPEEAERSGGDVQPD